MGVSRSQFTSDGFCDWKHANRLVVHELSKDHIHAVMSAASRSKGVGRIDSKLTTHVGQIEEYWCSRLRRLISVLKFICERGLALRGDDEIIGSPHNGNYLGLLELLAEYDDFLRQHIQNNANRGTGHTNYLSSTICEEIVRLMGNEVLNEIISRIKLSKYYSISLDSTPDEGHIDELTLIIRYMEHDTPVERLVKFLPNQGHKAQEMFEASTHRYAILSDLLKTVASGPVSVPKRISTTRWSCRAVAVKAVVQGYLPIREALAKIARDENETSKTCYEDNGLHDKMCKLETAIYAVFWHDILRRVDATSHAMQDPKLDLNTAVAMLKSLECFVREKRDCFHVY
ncbi:zinc finger MYM-type protein 1-like [Homarus americanus]|uniref:zinc finger MYM-type protein 1-like n=1 Tax=Homarus americanus TaxID=6706 RepID=UPI001C4949E3|nr:zinc finger MYM-type protein 1-like [Homarus americanus]